MNQKGFASLIVLAILVVALIVGVIALPQISGDIRSNAQVISTQSTTFSIQTDSDVGNLDGTSITRPSSTNKTVWLGTGNNQSASFLGLIFKGGNVPVGATIESAKLEVKASASSSTPIAFKAFIETSGATSLASAKLSSFSQSFTESNSWATDQTVTYDVTELLKQYGVGSGRSSYALALQGTNASKAQRNVWGSTTTSKQPKLLVTYTTKIAASPPPLPPPPAGGPPPPPGSTMPPHVSGESMAMHAWRVGGKNSPNPAYDKCDDGTDVVAAHNQYYVIAYDGIKYPTWHPPVVTNPITGSGKCYFGHEHGTDPQRYRYWDEIVQHFGKDQNGNGTITAMVINPSTGQITAGDRAGIPFGIANDHMDQYYNKEGRDSIFVRHEDHVGHKIEFVNMESDTQGNATHTMAQLPGTIGINIPYGPSSNYQPTGVVCTHFHKFHQGTHSGDAIRNNLHEVIFHSSCMSVNVGNLNAASIYPKNTVLLTGMMAFGKPGEYVRFCYGNRFTKVCPDGKKADGSCIVNDPLISKLPNAINSNSLGRNMVDRYCLENFSQLNPGNNYFNPYEIWEGDLLIQKANGDMLAEHGRQWDVLDPIRFVDPKSPSGFSYNSLECNQGDLLYKKAGRCDAGGGNYRDVAWDSPKSGFKGLKRTTYFGRNRVSNPNGAQIWWTDPLGGNAVTTAFSSGLKQKISPVEADICKLSVCSTLNDRSIQRQFSDGGGTVHAPN